MRNSKRQVRKIRGSGGGSDSPRIPVESPDTLESKAFVRIVDLVSEGEIVGLVDGAKSIYLDEVPLQNDNGSYNFQGVSYETREGTQEQTYMPGFTSVDNEVTVGVEVKHGGGDPTDIGIVRRITNPNVNRVRVRILIPALSETNQSNGDVVGASVTMALYLQPDGGSYTRVARRTVSGKSSGRFEVSLDTELTGDAPWNLKLVRESIDASDSYTQNKTYFESYTEIIDAKLRYPNSALVGIRFGAENFSNIPSRYYDMKLLKVRVPSNYDPETREYDGSWDGTFQVAWSDNPAWVFYDICTSDRYGLGAFLSDDQVDKWALYEIAQYCDEYVPDGFGSTEPRFTCNMMLFNREEAYTVLQNLASVFRGMTYWNAGSVTVSQDAPSDAAYLFTPANVVDGRFTYQGASAKARHTVALVSWNDPEDLYRTQVEYVEDTDGITQYGIQQTEITAFGCTSRGQAHRLGKWLLYTEQNESELVSFRTGIEGIVGRPGQIIRVADPSRAGVRRGGRISAATTTQVTIDSDFAGAASGYTLSVLLPSGAVEERTIINQSGRVLTVQPAFSTAPNPQSIWVIRSEAVEAQTFRVIGVKEESDGIFTITALRHDPDKFDIVEEDLVLEPKSYSVLTAAPDSPLNLTATETLYQSGSDVKSKATVSWDKVDRAVGYLVRYRKDESNFIDLPEQSFNDIEVLDTSAGRYTFQVCAVNAVGKKSVVSEITQDLYGKTAPPSSVSGFSMIPNAGQAYFSWTQATDLDVLVGGQVRIRHTPRIENQAWGDAIDIVPAVSGSSTSVLAPLLSGTYMAKFVDSSGNYSEDEVMIVTTVPYALALNITHTINEDPTFDGAKTNMIVDEAEEALVLSDALLIDDLEEIDSLGTIDFPGAIVSSGSYDFDNSIDLGGVWPISFSTVIDLEAFDIGNVIDSRADRIDTWEDIDGSVVNDVSAEIYLRHTDDDPAGTPDWSDWKRISAGEYSARAFEFQLRATSGNDQHNIYIRDLEVVCDMKDRALQLGQFTSGTDPSYRVNYTDAFWETPVVAITAIALNSGDYYRITNEDETGFDIVFKNSSDAIVSRVFNVIVKGYGRQVA